MAKTNKCNFPTIEGIQVISLIGKGTFSRVYKGIQLKEKNKVAVKVIDKKDLTKGKVDVIVSEIGIMKSLDHPHIVRMLDFKWDSVAVYIILEYCEGGNLHEYIKSHNRLREHVCKRALQQLASGLAYLRSKNICHMDLKPQNILMNYDPFSLKIADFGLAQYVPEKNYMDNLRGSPLYMAPEILLRRKYYYNVDLWSIGIILYECLFGRAPLAHKNCAELLDALRSEVPIKYPSTVPISKDCKDLLTKLLVYNPNERITYEDFFNHPFIDLAHAPTEENKIKAFRIIQEAVLCDEKKNYSKAFNFYCQALQYLVPFLDTVTASEERAYFQLKISEYLSRAEELKVILYKEDTYKDKIEQHWDLEEQKAAKESSLVFRPTLGNKNGKDITSLISSGSIRVQNESASLNPLSSSDVVSIATCDSDETKKGASSSSHSSSDPSRVDFNLSLSDESPSSIFEEHSPQKLKDLFGGIPKAQDAIDIGYIGQMYMVQGDYETAFQKYESALSILIPLLKEFPPGFRRDLLVHQTRKWLAQAESAKTLATARSIHCEERIKNGIEATENCSIQ